MATNTTAGQLTEACTGSSIDRSRAWTVTTSRQIIWIANHMARLGSPLHTAAATADSVAANARLARNDTTKS
jgi:hypothetical protein